MFARRWFATALIVPYMLPAWTFALAWTTLFRNRTIGGQQGWFEAMGFAPPDWLAYGQVPITIILALHYTPFIILLFGNGLRRFDSQLEDSARILGASGWTIARQVVLPLMRPALLSAVVLIFAKCLGEFGVAYVLGLPVKFDVLATSLFRNIASRQTGVAGVLAGAIMLMGVLTLLIDTYLVREARRFVTVGSKGSMNKTVKLRRWRIPATGFAGGMFLFSVGLPVLTLALSTVMKIPARFTLDNFTLQYWIGTDLDTVALRTGILLSPDLWSAAWNTLWIVGSASICSGILGLLVGYVVVRTPVPALSGFLRQITFLPYLVPGIAFAAAYLSLFAVQRGPIPALYGTIAILMLALMAEQMPYASRAGISAMMQLGKEPEEAAQISGAGWLRRMTRVVIPIQKGSLVTGVLLPFISGIKGLSLFVMLAVPSTDVLTTFSLRLVDYHYTQAANAVVLIIAAIAYFGTLAAQKLTGTNLAEGLGG
jgi:iron(III) transport system permease protein